MANGGDLKTARAIAYDLVYNGVEIGGGSLRIYRRWGLADVFRHIIDTYHEASLFSHMASDDVASNTRQAQGLADVSRHVIDTYHEPSFFSYMACYDEASFLSYMAFYYEPSFLSDMALYCEPSFLSYMALYCEPSFLSYMAFYHVSSNPRQALYPPR